MSNIKENTITRKYEKASERPQCLELFNVSSYHDKSKYMCFSRLIQNIRVMFGDIQCMDRYLIKPKNDMFTY